ncbi:MAG: hypothetical protein ACSLFE_00045 [Gemmatimonadaceae bacterium]
MLSRLFPQRMDNDYRGYKIALVIFGLVVAVRIAIGFGSIVNGYGAATGPDGIPLDTFPPAATQTILSLFAMLGLSRLLLSLLCILVLIRYRAMVPLMFAVLLIEQLGRQAIVYFLPIPRVGAPPVSVIHLTLLGLMVVGLGLSLLSRKPSATAT